MPEINKNLRILSLAYSNGKLTKEQYTSLRSKQLSAIEFGKPFPPLPPGLSNVNVPNVKIDVPSGGSSKKTALIIAGIAILAAIGIGAYFLSKGSDDSTNQTEKNTQSSSPNAMAFEGLAKHLASNKTINADELKAYAAQWNTLSAQQQKLARKAPWFSTLTSNLTQLAKGSDEQAVLASDLLGDMGVATPQKPAAKNPPAQAAQPALEVQVTQPQVTTEQPITPAPTVVAPEQTATEITAPITQTSEVQNPVSMEETPQLEVIEPAAQTISVETPETIVTPTEAVEPITPQVNETVESVTETVEEAANTSVETIQTTIEEPVKEDATEHIPNSSKSGVDLNPEYEREPEFGKAARDALFSDTPEY